MKEKILVEKLMEKNYTIASAESCTGGMFASTIVNVPNASSVINASVVTYSNEAKQKFCDVKKETLKAHGAVSEEVAREMAEGIKNTCDANVGVAFSGIAGPGGATPNKPVGMVCFAFCINGTTCSFTQIFKGNRTKVRKKSVNFAIDKLIELLG